MKRVKDLLGYSTRFLSQSEIDFLQGRVSGSVFTGNYNPAPIVDLKTRIFRALEDSKVLS